MKVAFYKGKGGTFNKLIRWWTKSDYSHVELIIDGVWYSSSHIDGGVRGKVIEPKPGHWDIYQLKNVDTLYARDCIRYALTHKYDWTGIIFSQIFPLGLQNPERYFCSELVGEALSIDYPQRYSPGELFLKLRQQNKLNPLNEGFFISKEDE